MDLGVLGVLGVVEVLDGGVHFESLSHLSFLLAGLVVGVAQNISFVCVCVKNLN